MVQLQLAPLKGSLSSRYFPFHGFLGLTPVRVEGTVRTKLEEDGKPLLARALTVSVRCYESRISRYRTTTHSTLLVDHTEVLWSKPDAAEWASVGDLEFPFKLTVPRRSPGLSSANFHDYRTFWRVEAALEHIPLTGVGSRILKYFDLPLVRYDLPSHSLPSSTPPSPTHALCLQTSKPRAPVIRYNISTPTVPVGPGDVVVTSLFIQPIDPSVSVRGASVVIERRIDLHHTPSSSLSPPSSTSLSSFDRPSVALDLSDDATTPASSSSYLPQSFASEYPTNIRHPQDSPSGSITTLDLSVNSVVNSTTRLLSTSPSSISIPSPNSSHTPLHSPYLTSPTDAPERTLATNVISVEGTGFACDSTGIWTKTITQQWPASKTQSRWALGETMHTDLASVRFYVKVRVSITSSSGADVLDLEERELPVVAVNEADRQAALSKYTDGGLRSKSKSPWRARQDQDEKSLPSPPQSPATPRSVASSTLVPPPPSSSRHPKEVGRSSLSTLAVPSSGSRTHKTARRPHTSAGPRDKSNLPYAVQGEAGLRSDPDSNKHTRAEHTRKGSRSSGIGRDSAGLADSMLYSFGDSREKERERRRLQQTKRADSAERTHVKGPKLGADHVRAWEEELARIEQASRRSSATMLGSWGFGRKKLFARG